MAVSRKAKREDTSAASARQDDAAFRAYLHKGGGAAKAVPESPSEEQSKGVRFSLTIPGKLCQQLDDLREDLPVKTSRHQWVLQAIAEKIAHDAVQK